MRARLVALDTPTALRARLFEPRVRVVLTQPAQQFAATLQEAGVEAVRFDGRSLSVSLNGTLTTPAMVRQLVHAGAEIESVVREEASLEDVYLRLLHPESPSS